ncbi:hypothetical protein ACHAQA_008351 [Verticillium albo-atrum]
MPSFYFDTTPGTTQFYAGPSAPFPPTPNSGAQIHNQMPVTQPPSGPAAATRSPPLNAPTQPKGKGNKKAKRGEKGVKRKVKNNGATEERDKVVAPSAASGGIPNPTPAYLAQAQAPPSSFPRPRAILVVLDLNGTLLHRPDRRKSHNFIERPYAKRFMHYCIDTLHVAVWSSARPENVTKMVAQLAEGGGDVAPASYVNRLVAAWGRDKFDLSSADYAQRVQCYKRLQRIWADPAIQAAHPDGARWDQTNTVLVDDSLEKARSEPYNLLRIPEFFGDADEATDVLPQVHDYINLLCYQSDISQYMRLHPFELRGDYTLERPPSA